MSPPKSLSNDVFTVHLNEGKEGSMVVQAIKPNCIEGLWFNERSGGGFDASVPNHQLDKFSYIFRHYYRGYEIRTGSPLEFIVNRLIGHSILVRAWDRLWQWRFNRRQLARQGRIAVLRYFVEKTQETQDFSAGRLQLVADLYGNRSILHPSFNALSQYYHLVLESLADEKLLEFDNHQVCYRLHPKGLTALQAAEEDDRRHNDNLKIQRQLVAVTFLLVVAAIFQIIIAVREQSQLDSSTSPVHVRTSRPESSN